ncbi:hypothetical protein IKL64_08430 [bacterium]|nr:hypothetical protein [bacterium]
MSKVEQPKLSTLANDIVQISDTKRAGRNIGQIYEKVIDETTGKIVKKPIDVDIEIEDRKSWDQTVYHFKHNDKEVGYVILEDHINIPEEEKIFLLTSDIPQFGIVGDRVIVKHLMNLNQKRYAGIGELADRIAVEHCNRRGIKPVIISEASYNSHAAHYKRGKRYLYSDENNNPNKIVEEIIKNTPSGEQCDTSRLGMLISYMPKELIAKIQQYLSKNPILK